MMNKVVEELSMRVNNDIEDFVVRSVREEAFKAGVSIEVNARKILEAVQKQTPNKCGHNLPNLGHNYKYCPFCGQRLDRSDENDSI